ncbi:flippase [Halorientalis halophila]|uniref:flippase n=1 Tax=Halorientalis halophila TaxID=3108499 RepID=UPI00300AB08A
MSEASEEEQSVTDSLSTVFSGGLLVSAGKVVALGLGFLTQVAMARLLAEGAYGQVVLTLSVISVAGLVAKLGLDSGVTRKYPHHEGEPAEALGVVRSSLFIAGISGVAVGCLVFVLAPFIAQRIFNEPSLTVLFRIAAVIIPFNALSWVAVSLAQGARNARPHTYVKQLFQPIVRFLAISGLLIGGFGAAGAIAGQTTALVLAAILALLLLHRSLPTFDTTPVPMHKSLLTFSIPLLAVQGMGFLNTNVDIYMVGYFLASSDLGIYNIALQIGNLVTALLSTAGFLLPPMLTRLQKNGQTAEMRRTYQVLTKWMVVLILPGAVVLFFAPELVIGLLFGERYVPGVTALRILLIGKVVAIVMGLNTQALIALGENRFVSYLVFFQTVVNVIVNYSLIPIIGIEGAAIGMMVSAILGDVVGVGILYREYEVHPLTKAILGPVGAVCAVAVLGYALVQAANLPTYFVVVIVGIAYVPIVATLAPEPEDEQLLTRVEDRTGYELTFVRRAFRLVG